MKKLGLLLSIALLLPVAAAPSSALAQAPAKPAEPAPAELSAEQVAQGVQTFYDKAKTYRADFHQKYTIKAYGRTKTSEGKVVFAKPGKMSWRYSSNANRVVSDGNTLKVYEADKKQLYIQSVKKSQYPAALAFLLGDGSLTKAFTLKKLNSTTMKFPSGYVLLGIPKDATPSYQKMLMYVDKQTFQVRRVLLIDAQKNKNRFDFTQARVNEKVAPAEFQFTPPPGTTTVRP